jgi:hypothetical protein
MNFNQYWAKQPAINLEKCDISERIRTEAAKAFHFAQRQERERCIAAVESVKGANEPAPDHAYEFMIKNREQFDSGINAIVDLTKSSAVDAIKNTKG